MFGSKNTPCTLTVEELPDVCDDILVSTAEYKKMLRKEVALDLICDILNDKNVWDEFRYSMAKLAEALLRHANPEKFVPDEPEPEPAPEKEGDPF